MVLQLIANGIISACTYALIAFGFGLIYNATRVFHFAHGAICTLSVYVFFTCFTTLELPILFAFIVALIIASIAGVLTDTLVYWPLYLKQSSLLVLMISSLGLNSIIINFIALVYGNETKTLISGLQPTYTLGSIVLSEIQIIIAISSIIFITLLFILFTKTNLGKLIRAMRDDIVLLSGIGINPRIIRIIVFIIGSSISSLATILVGLDFGIEPNISNPLLLKGAIAVIIGGLDSFGGAVIGAIVLSLVETLSLCFFPAKWSNTVVFIVLILFLLIRSREDIKSLVS
ncbi:MAG TPA: branched-chain amino acid ABC transporter permease [Chitinophagaceae bacterium]|jgi:branched-chain amino acid transport system permease protein|nr:branched-chain amino acid ABC transporter permease [Chitinophagaceae bacterium]